jgi:hypothetical protein
MSILRSELEMSEQIIRRCDLCGKETDNLYNCMINFYYRKTYQDREKEHYCADFDICYECSEKYRLPNYSFVDGKIEFIKENSNFLSKLWKKVKGCKEDRV